MYHSGVGFRSKIQKFGNSAQESVPKGKMDLPGVAFQSKTEKSRRGVGFQFKTEKLRNSAQVPARRSRSTSRTPSSGGGTSRTCCSGAGAPSSAPRCPRRTLRCTTPSLFPRLVLSWINADFRVQIRIFQHFSRSTRKSSSREQICKIKQNFMEFCKNFENFLEISEKMQNFGNFDKKFADFFTEFCKIL